MAGSDFIDPFDKAVPQGARAMPAAPPPSNSGFVDPFDRPGYGGTAPPAPLADMPTPAPAEDTSMMGRVRSGATWLQNQITGKDRTEFDFPNLDASALRTGGDLQPRALKPGESIYTPQQAKESKTLGMLDFASDDKARLDMIREARPDVASTAKEDRFGNIYVTVDGKPFYLNKPGLTVNALRGAGASAIASAPLAIATGGAGVGASLPIRAGLSSIIGAGGSIIQDLIAGQAGSKQGVDLPRAATAGVFGAGFEMAAPAKAALVNLFRGNPEFATVTNTGAVNLTQKGQEAFAKAGIDVRTLPQDALKAFMRDVRGAVSPEDAARASGARGLPVPIPLSRGDITGKPSQQMFESLSEKGAFGQGAESVMRGFRSEQQEAIRGNVPALQNMIGGGQITERGQAGANAVATLQSQKAAQKAGVDAAYEAARGAGAGVDADALSRVYSGIVGSDGVRDRIAFAPNVKTLVDDLASTLAKARQGGDSATNIKALYEWRRKASLLQAEAGTQSERTAAKNAVQAFDAQMDDLAANALIQGDAQAVALWKDAIGKASANFKKWDSDTLVAKLADADPLAASNIIFGSKDAGFINSPELVKGIKLLKSQLPRENWDAIREEAFLRLAQMGEGAYQGANRDFSGVNFKKAWDSFMMKNAPLARELFSGEERQTISQFATQAAKATGRVRGGDNFSNTTPAAANMIQRFFNMPFMTAKVAAVLSNTPGASSALGMVSTSRAVGSTSGAIPKVRGFPALTGTVGNVATGDQ